MPVWHDVTREWQASGELLVVGITQEQHPDRCRLFAQWKEFDWPILWDPFNLTESSAVPVVLFVDEHGVVRGSRMRPEEFEASYLHRSYEPPAETPTPPEPAVQRELAGEPPAEPDASWAMAECLWGDGEHLDRAVEVLEESARATEDPAATFRAGVARRLRYDSPRARPEDFQASIDHWTDALARNPNQYIWRRRVQQYGPRLDKPYPFYGWIAAAQQELRDQGREPVTIVAALTGSELAGPTRELPRRGSDAPESPDPKREITRDEDGLVRVESAVALHSGAVAGMKVRARPTARVHLAFRPDAGRDVHWTNDAGPSVVWVSVPSGWSIAENLYTLEAPSQETSNEVRRLDFEIVPPERVTGSPRVRGYALYYVCEGADGTCVYRRKDFTVDFELPRDHH